MVTDQYRCNYWERRVESKPNRREIELLENLPLEDSQFVWLLGEYLMDTLWPSPRDFAYYVQSKVKAEELPDPLSCAAWLTENSQLCNMADELEELLGVWEPNEATEARIHELQSTIKGAIE